MDTYLNAVNNEMLLVLQNVVLFGVSVENGGKLNDGLLYGLAVPHDLDDGIHEAVELTGLVQKQKVASGLGGVLGNLQLAALLVCGGVLTKSLHFNFYKTKPSYLIAQRYYNTGKGLN